MVCNICPRRCGVDRSVGTGRCGCGEQMLVARAALHMWEEPCISGTGGSGAIFFGGCNLGCVFCQNSLISRGARGRVYTQDDVIAAIKRLEDEGAETINFVNPTHYSLQLRDILTLYKPSVPVVWNSGGYESAQTLKLLDGLVDVYLPDMKYFDSKTGERYADCPDYFENCAAAVTEMVRQTGGCVFDGKGIIRRGTVVRHLVLPSNVHQSFKILGWIAQNLPRDVYVSLMGQYFPATDLTDFPEINRKLTRREYRRVLDKFAELGLENGFEQELSSAAVKYVPEFDIGD